MGRKGGNKYFKSSSNAPKSQPSTVYSVQNQAHSLSNPYNQGHLAPAYVPPPPSYSSLNPTGTNARSMIQFPPVDYSMEGLIMENNIPRDVEQYERFLSSSMVQNVAVTSSRTQNQPGNHQRNIYVVVNNVPTGDVADYGSQRFAGPSEQRAAGIMRPLTLYPPGDYRNNESYVPKTEMESVIAESTDGSEGNNPFSERVIRRAFIRKVYITLGIQLIVTGLIICMFIFWDELRYWVRQTPYFVYALLGVLLVLTIVFIFVDKIRRKVPMNFIFLGIYTVVLGCVLGSVSALFSVLEVLWAVGATVLVSVCLTLFALQTKWDFTVCSGGLCVILMSLLSFGILGAIYRSYWLSITYAALGTLIFGMYLVVDTQLLMGGKHRYSISPEDYIYAALNLYLDVANLFLLILRLFGR